MSRAVRLGALVAVVVTIAPAVARGDGPGRSWGEPTPVGPALVFENATELAAGDRIVSAQRRPVGVDTTTIGIAEVNGRSGVATDTTLWTDSDGGSHGYAPRVAVASTGRMAAAFFDGHLLHIDIRDPGGSWHEVDTVPMASADFTASGPLLAFSPLGHLAVAWSSADGSGGIRLSLAELAPGSQELTAPRAVDPDAAPGTVQAARDLAVSADGEIALAYLEAASTTSSLTAHVAFGPLGSDLAERHSLPGIVTPWSSHAPQVGFDGAGNAAIAWDTVPSGLDDSAILGDLHLVLRRTGGALGPQADFGLTPVLDAQDLAVSDPGEVLLTWDAAGNLSGGDGSWGYSRYGYEAVSASTVGSLIGTPQRLPWDDDQVHLAMNRRGDAVLASTKWATTPVVYVRRRVPGGTFGDPALVAAQDVSGSAPMLVGGVAIDDTGNAMVNWSGFAPQPSRLLASVDGPLLDTPLPGLPIEGLPPILPSSPPAEPPQPLLIPAQLPQTTPASIGEPLILSAKASRIHGLPSRVRLRVRCDQRCAVQASGRLAGAKLRGFNGNVTEGRTATLTIKLSVSARRRARLRLRLATSTTAKLTVSAASVTGAHAARSLRITIRRR